MRPATRLDGIELSLIRQINALATPDSISLGIGEPNIEPDAHFRELARRVAGEASWHYSANAGLPELRRALASSLGAGVNPDTEVIVTAGTEEGLYAIAQAWVDAGDEVLVPDPGFVAYSTLATIAGARVVTYPLAPDDWTLDAGAIIERITPSTKLIVINSPSNPLGSIAAADELQTIARVAEERDIIVVSDEVYRELWYDQQPASMLGMSRNVIVLGGMSKSHAMTGLRLGWIVGAETLIAPILKAHQYIATCAPVFSQALAVEVLRDGEWNARWLTAARAQFREQRTAALQSIERELDVAIAAPAAAFYAFVPVPECSSLTFAKALATEAGVLVIPGIAFGKNGEGFVRISYAASIENITNGIARIGAHLRRNAR
jgi:aspartate aminotransferase